MEKQLRQRKRRLVGIVLSLAVLLTTFGTSRLQVFADAVVEGLTYYTYQVSYSYDGTGAMPAESGGSAYDPADYVEESAAAAGTYVWKTGYENGSFSITTPAADTKDGFYFYWLNQSGSAIAAGSEYWLTFRQEEADSQMTLSPAWVADHAAVVFDLNGGTDSTGAFSDTVSNYLSTFDDTEYTYTLPSDTPTKAGYTFENWKRTDPVYGAFEWNPGDMDYIMIDKSVSMTAVPTVTYVAQWTADVTKPILNTSLGSAGTYATVATEASVDMDDNEYNITMPSIDTASSEWPYTLTGWSYTVLGNNGKDYGSGTTANTLISIDVSSLSDGTDNLDEVWPVTISLTAVWDETDYTVNFYDEDGTTLLGTSTGIYGATLNAPTTPTKASTTLKQYTFNVWMEADTGAAVTTLPTVITKDMNYRASYTETDRTYDVSLVVSSDEATYTGSAQSGNHSISVKFDGTTYTGLDFVLDGVTYTVSGVTASSSGTDAGEYTTTVDTTGYTVTTTGAAVTDVTANFPLNGIEQGKFTINQASIQGAVVGGLSDVTYDGNEHKQAPTSVTFGGTALVEGTDYAISYTGTDFTNAGTKSLSLTGMGNFKDSVTATYTINKAAATVTANNANKTYGEADPTFTAQVSGLAGTDSLVYTVTRSNAGTEAVGTYSGVITATGDAEQGNYTVTYVNADFEIVKAGTMTITGTDYTGDYDGAAHGAAAVCNVTDGTTITYSTDGGTTYTANAPTIINVGTTTVDVLAVNANYTDAHAQYTLTVNAKAVTVTANPATKQAGEADPTFTATVDGLVGSDTISYTISRTAGETAGTYPITVTGDASQGNYAVTYVNSTLTITALPSVTISYADGQGNTYGADTAYAPVTITQGTQTDTTAYVTISSTEPTRTGYFFAGWSYGDTIYAAGNIIGIPYSVGTATITATWKAPKTATWTYAAGAGSYTGETSGSAKQNSATDTYFAVAVSQTAPVYSGHTFSGWYCSADGNIYAAGAAVALAYSDSANTEVTFTAIYDLIPIIVQVSYDAQGGYAPGADVQYYAMTDIKNTAFVVSLPALEPVKTRAFFDGWMCSLDGNVYPAGTQIPMNYMSFNYGTNAVTFTAVYTPAKTSDIMYVLGVGADYFEVVQLDRAATTFEVMLNSEEPTYEEHYFEGWRNSIDGQLYPAGTVFIYDYDTVKNVVFTSEWTRIIDTGNYDLDGLTRYKFSDGNKQIGSDPTVYTGGEYFYLKEDSNITIR